MRKIDFAPNVLRRFLVLASASTALGGFGAVQAQGAFPTKPITVIVPFVAGGPTDTFARTVANGLSQALGQTVTVENRAGAGGNIATAQFLSSAADGYTILVGASYLVVSPYLYKSVTYDPVKDFLPVGPPVESHVVFVTKAGGPDMKAMLESAKTSKDPIKLASPGAGTLSHLGGVALGVASGAPMTHVAYRGVGPAITDVMAGHVDLMIDGMSSSLPLVKSGKLKAVAVPSLVRDPLMPDVPTVAELGFPGMEVLAWNAAFVQPGTPKDVVDKLTSAITAVLAKPEVGADLRARGLFPTTLNTADFRARMGVEAAHWKAIITSANITVD